MIEFEQRFISEEVCREYLYQIRWPEGFICPRCGHQKCWKMQSGLYRCSKCKYHLSVTAGTIFQDSRIPLLAIMKLEPKITTIAYPAF